MNNMQMNQSPQPSISAGYLSAGIFNLGQSLVEYVLAAIEMQQADAAFSLEGSILAVTSKIVSLSEKRIVSKDSMQKTELVRAEADHYLGEVGYGTSLTIKHGLFIASAGIDESNAAGEYFILYPQHPFESAKRLHEGLKKALQISRFGVLLTDSHTSPLRAGVTGIALAHYGFRAVHNHVGEKDLFGRTLKMTRVNVADALAATAVFVMGEAAECRPLAWIRAGVEFISPENEDSTETIIAPERDLYGPLYRSLVGDR